MTSPFKLFSVLLFSMAIVFMSVSPASAQSADADALVGVWEPGHGKAKVKISKLGDKYYGKIVQLKEPNDDKGNPKKDVNNPDESMRSTPLLGYRILKDFEYKGDGTWEEGTIYDPENGTTYNCVMKLKDANTLEVRGYIGVAMIGRTDTWSRLVKQ